jgi:hypothetical protein
MFVIHKNWPLVMLKPLNMCVCVCVCVCVKFWVMVNSTVVGDNMEASRCACN